ncbi:zinc finger, CCHC-type containing protein [Tanacetum coccineum]|uniref:Zinc finger, CCHC-type containing protein n=1 Tax=Tanacetum coccineum TaxID=301880 RepID=A0ABQ4XBP8_9ASTR
MKLQLLTHHSKMVWLKGKNRALKEMVNSMLSYSGLSNGFWGEAILTACYLLNRVPNKRNKTTPYELWYKKRANLAFLRVWGCRAVVRLPDPKRKTLGEKGIDYIFVGYAEHSKAYRFYVIEPNDSVSINSIIESRDVIFDENHFSSIPRPKDIIPNAQESQMDDHTDDVPSEIPEPQKGKRVCKAKSYGSDFQLYLVEGSRDQVRSQYSYCFSIEEDPRTYNEVMQSRDAAFWKEVIDDEIGSIMENNTWVLSDLPPGCKPLGCKWIFKRKMKVDGTINKFKARLVIQGSRQKEGIDYFDTYAPVARIISIRLLLALAAIHNLVIHQMDVKTAFLNGDLDEEVYMKQLEGFVMSGNEHKVENLKPNTGKPVDQLEYSRAIACLMYAMTSTRLDIAYVVGRLSMFTSNPSRQHWKAITKDSKKQTCITGSTMESEFVALAVAGKEAEWLRNLIHEIPIWLKLIAPISIRCDSAPIMARAYSQIYNGKSIHLEAKFNVESSYLEIGTQLLSSRGARSKGTAYDGPSIFGLGRKLVRVDGTMRGLILGDFISKIARKSRVLTEEIIRSMSTPVYGIDLDRTTLRELIDSEDKLIPNILVDDVQRFAAQRALRVLRASMQDLYERMGSMEIRHEAIQRMEYRQSYYWDRYQGIFEHMAGVYNVPLLGAYNPPGYAQPQYDQYYQQYYPQQPPQQQHDDEEEE